MEIPRHWRLRKQRYALVGEVCPHCDAKIFPPRDVCPYCGGEAKNEYAFSGKGEIYSFTVMHDAPAGFDETLPYTVALVTQPSADVTITLNPGPNVAISPATLTFTSANWNVPQTVNVTAQSSISAGTITDTIGSTSSSGDSVEPLPFHAMSRYPYPASEHFPDDAAHRAWRKEYNVRHSVNFIGPLVAGR